jgi:two-component system response regulator PilR (NtrC family)
VPVRKRILIVDDDEAVLLVLHDILAELCGSLEIVACADAAEAVDRVEAEHFDLVLTDLKMPEVDGVALTRVVRDTSEDTVVIWLTAYGSDESREMGGRLGVYRVLDKPLEVNEIQAVVRDALRRTGKENPCPS